MGHQEAAKMARQLAPSVKLKEQARRPVLRAFGGVILKKLTINLFGGSLKENAQLFLWRLDGGMF